MFFFAIIISSYANNLRNIITQLFNFLKSFKILMNIIAMRTLNLSIMWA